MKNKIYKYLNNKKKYAPIIAKEIIETFEYDANDSNVEYSFTICRKTGKVSSEDPNTYFVFDTKKQTELDKFKKYLFHEDLKDIKEDSDEEKKLMEDVRDFLLEVCNIITENYKSSIEKTIRRVVLGNKVSNKDIPLKTIKVLSIDIADYTSVPESCKNLLKIGKKPNSDINTDDVVSFVQNRQEKTGMDIETILSIEKKAGNPLFKNVEAIILGKKFLNEISIYLFVDYSIEEANLEEIDKHRLE